MWVYWGQGQALGSCAVMSALRREAIGSFRVEDAWQLPELVAAVTERRRSDTSVLDS